MPEGVSLTMKELDRLQAMTQIAEHRLTRRRAAERLQLSERQVRRLYDAFATTGAAGLASRRRGRPSGRRLAEATQAAAVAPSRSTRAPAWGPSATRPCTATLARPASASDSAASGSAASALSSSPRRWSSRLIRRAMVATSRATSASVGGGTSSGRRRALYRRTARGARTRSRRTERARSPGRALHTRGNLGTRAR